MTTKDNQTAEGGAGTDRFRPLSLRMNFSWTFTGNVVFSACQWGLLVVLAQLGTPSVVGLFALSVALARPIFMFSLLQLQVILVTDAKRSYRFGHYLGLRILTTLLALGAVLVMVVVSGYERQLGLIVLLQGAAMAFSALADLYQGQFLRHERMDRYAISVFLRSPLSLLALALGYYLSGQLLVAVAAMAVVEAGVLLLYDLPVGNRVARGADPGAGQGGEGAPGPPRLTPLWERTPLLHLAWLSLPLGLVMLLTNLLTQIPRYFIGYYQGEHTLGIFAALSQFMLASHMFVMTLGQASTPRLASYYAAGDLKMFKSLLARLGGLGALVGGAGLGVSLVAGRLVLTTFYGSEYGEFGRELNWLMVVGWIMCLNGVLGFAMSAARYFRVQLPIMAGVVLLFCLGCLFLIPDYGILGAAVSQGVAMTAYLGGEAAVVLHALRKAKARKEAEQGG